jgi:hypothetical protein
MGQERLTFRCRELNFSGISKETDRICDLESSVAAINDFSVRLTCTTEKVRHTGDVAQRLTQSFVVPSSVSPIQLLELLVENIDTTGCSSAVRTCTRSWIRSFLKYMVGVYKKVTRP